MAAVHPEQQGAVMIDRFLEGLDLTTVHTILTIAGMFLAVYVMQLTSHVNEDHNDPLVLRWGRRASLASVALALLWSLSYSQTKGWQPWPPELALVVSVIAILGVRAIAIHARMRRDGIRRALPLAGVAAKRPGN